MNMKVRNILARKSKRIITIGPGQSVKEAVVLMTEQRIGALPVLDDRDRLIGIISERDVIWRMVTEDEILALSVQDVMSRDVIIGMPQDDLVAVVHTMTERRFRHLPVCQEGVLIGIISIGDVLKAQRDEYEGEIDTLTQIVELQ